MKLASFTNSGQASYGVVVGDGIVDAGRRLRDRFPTLRHALSEQGLGELARLAGEAEIDHRLDEISFLLPVPDPGKIVCVGRNYAAHVAEANIEAPPFPNLFARFVSSLVPHGGSVVRPSVSTDFDYEGELALVIGKPGRNIPESEAMSHIAGYSCFNDGSIRDYQLKHSLLAGKNFESSGSMGPWIVTSDEIADVARLQLRTRVNGQETQNSGIDKMIFDVPGIIAYVSTFTSLAPGDVIATGTPEGVGFARKPPLWLKPGDTVEVEISGIGTLANTVIDDA